jgi:DNA-directed RNA polymerase specialized sigma24 family protein
MKTKHKTHTRRHPHSDSSRLAKGFDFESLASDLDQLAKGKLPDGCLNGVLRGQEQEIRQDAILLALRWFGNCSNKDEWGPAASIAHALRFMKRRYARRLSGRPEHIQINDEFSHVSLVLEGPDSVPMSGRPHAIHMAIQAIHQATQRGRISTSNAAVVLMVLQDGQPVGRIAKKLNLTRGAIHYHINQVRAALPAIVANIEEPGFRSKSNVPEERN